MRKALFIFIVFHSIMSNAQVSDLEKELLVWFDNKMGDTNIDLSNGLEVIEQYPGYPSGSHKYFSSRYFTNGNINYLGQDFYGISMAYDVLEDKVIAKVGDNKNIYVIQFLSNRVNSFTIHSTNFVRINDVNINGFFELMKETIGLKLYRKHKKLANGRDVYGNETAAFTFEDVKPEYVIEFKNNFRVIKEKSDLYELFPNIQKQISNALKKDRTVRYAWRKKDMLVVFNKIHEILLKEKVN